MGGGGGVEGGCGIDHLSCKLITRAFRRGGYTHTYIYNNVFFSVPFLLQSTRPIARNKISEKKKEEKKLSHFAIDN